MDAEPGKRKTILVIEDSASVRRLVEVTLRSLDAEVSAAEDGIEGLEKAEQLLPDVIVLDIGLPRMDGWEVLGELRRNPATAKIRVIVLTAHAQPEVAALAEESGVDAFMTKPFRPLELRAEIVRILDET